MSLEDQLFDAVTCGDEKRVMELLGLEVYINARNKTGLTPMHLAVLCDNLSMAKLLFRFGANVNTKDWQECTPLYTASSNNNFNIVDFLLALKARFDIRNNKDRGNFPIHIAAEKGCTDIVKALLSPETINIKNYDGFAPIHLAVQNNHKDVVMILIEYSYTKINMHENIRGDTPLILAVKVGNTSIVKLLLEHGADFNQENKNKQTFGEFADTSEMVSIVSQYERLSDIPDDISSNMSSPIFESFTLQLEE